MVGWAFLSLSFSILFLALALYIFVVCPSLSPPSLPVLSLPLSFSPFALLFPFMLTLPDFSLSISLPSLSLPLSLSPFALLFFLLLPLPDFFPFLFPVCLYLCVSPTFSLLFLLLLSLPDQRVSISVYLLLSLFSSSFCCPSPVSYTHLTLPTSDGV